MPRIDARGRNQWSKSEARLLARLNTPEKIQQHLDQMTYRAEDACCSPRRALRDNRAHCMDGGLLAAAALRFHGQGCRVLDMAAVRDDDHIIALFHLHGFWGDFGKSNFA